ncbi:MAG: ABC transporter permease [Gemmatimonadaceae bacterium]
MPDTPAVSSHAIPEPAHSAPMAQARPLARALATLWRDRAARVALLFLGALALAALLAPLISPHAPEATLGINTLNSVPPSRAHWMGTDPASRDVLSRMLHGARISLAIALLSALLASGVGLVYGGVAGYVGGVMDGIMMRTIDALLSIPRILMLITVLALWGQVDVASLVVLLGLTGWFGVSRIARAAALAASAREYVTAAHALGARRSRTFVRHVFPHLTGPVLVAATISVGQVILLEAGLSYLGYGVPQPNPTWGNIIRDGRETMSTAWWLTFFPGIALISTALAVNTLADRLRTALNPRQLDAP